MGLLANHVGHFDEIKKIISTALYYFDRKDLQPEEIESLRMASDLAFSDEILLEKFRMWYAERDDEILMFHIRRFFSKKREPVLPESERNQSHRRVEIEGSIKLSAREKVKKIFSQRLTALALKNGLDNNAKLGQFLGVSEEQARKFRSGEHKPQLATLKVIAEKFSVRPEYLSGHAED